MVQTTSSLDVADNSGAKKLMCIRVLGGTRRKYASLGDIIVVSIKEAIPNAKVKKGDVMNLEVLSTAVSRFGPSTDAFTSTVAERGTLHVSCPLPDAYARNKACARPPNTAHAEPRQDERAAQRKAATEVTPWPLEHPGLRRVSIR